jgi:SAM-dependent methyltransferase
MRTSMSRYGDYEEQPFVAELYDASYMERGDVDFYVELAKKSRGRTLELGCGTGRILVPTARAGCEITGLDLSSFMLEKCRETMRREPPEIRDRIRLVEGNMADFDLEETYSLVTTPFRSFQHLLTPEEHRSCLRCAHKHLRNGGGLVLEVFHPYLPRLHDTKYMEEEEITPWIELPDGRRFRRTTRTIGFHREKQYNDIEIIYYVTLPDGREERYVQAFPMRYFFRYEMEHMLELEGFRVTDLFGDFNRSEFVHDSPEMIFVAERI